MVKIDLQIKFFQNTDFTRHDSYFVWNYIELTVGILAGSLHSLRPIFKSILASSSYLTSHGNKKSGIATIGGGVTTKSGLGTKHKYYMQEDELGIPMEGFRGAGDKMGYDANVMSLEDRSEGEGTLKGDGESTQDILPMQGSSTGITRTVDIRVA